MSYAIFILLCVIFLNDANADKRAQLDKLIFGGVTAPR
jgi:hypothetical protein